MNENMTPREMTEAHIATVRRFLIEFMRELEHRAHSHDKTKLESPEVEIFNEYTQKLKGLTYGSEEYKQCLAEMKPALDHHYAENSHHPEHYENGVDGMDLVDLVEMLCDWECARKRHGEHTLSLEESLKYNVKRFNIESQLEGILLNTIRFLEKITSCLVVQEADRGEDAC